ncbi:hypothetical protein D3C71_1148110 [compost metagenome]
MSNHQDGGVGGAQGAHQRLAHLGLQVPVQAGEGLVQQDGVRPPRQGAHQGHTLLLAARQHMRPGVGPVGQMHGVQPFQGRAAALGARPVLEPEGDVVGDAEVRKQGVVLEHQSDAARLWRGRARGVGQQPALGVDGSSVHRLQPGDHPQQRALAAARGAEQGGDAAGVQVQVNAVDGEAGAETPRGAAHGHGGGHGGAHRGAPGREAAILRVSQITPGSARTMIISDGQPACGNRSSLA